MDFKIKKEHEMLRKAVRDYAKKELSQTAFERDSEEKFDREIQFNRLAELDLPGIIFPETYGGAEADYQSYVIAVEELSKCCASTGVVLSAHISMAANPIFLYGTEEQKQKYLKPLAEGTKLGCLALTENEAGSDIGGILATAHLDGEEWVLNGDKIFITNGGDAEIVVGIFRTDENATEPEQGLSAFIIEKGTKGLSIGRMEKTLGYRSASTRELIFENCRIAKENLLGKQGEGAQLIAKTMDSARIATAAQAIGIAQGAYEEALKYSKTRYQFGKPINQFQNLRFKLVDMISHIEAARHLVFKAAWCVENQQSCTKEAAMAKMVASDTAMWVATEAVQIHGGNGYAKDYPPERMMRDAKITQIYAGTNEIQRVTIGDYIIK